MTITEPSTAVVAVEKVFTHQEQQALAGFRPKAGRFWGNSSSTMTVPAVRRRSDTRKST